MQKKLFLASILIGCPLILTKSDNKGLLDQVIENADLMGVEKVLADIGPLEPSYKAGLIKDAQNVMASRTAHISLLKSKRDLAKLAIGSAFAMGCIMGAAHYLTASPATSMASYMNQQANFGIYVRELSVYGVGALVGFYIALKGFFCDTAYTQAIASRKIVDLLKNARVKSTQSVQTGKKSNCNARK